MLEKAKAAAETARQRAATGRCMGHLGASPLVLWTCCCSYAKCGQVVFGSGMSCVSFPNHSCIYVSLNHSCIQVSLNHSPCCHMSSWDLKTLPKKGLRMLLLCLYCSVWQLKQPHYTPCVLNFWYVYVNSKGGGLGEERDSRCQLVPSTTLFLAHR